MAEARQRSTKRIIRMSEVQEHDSDADPWLHISGKVYAVKDWLPSHPAGADIILREAGGDATSEFEDRHSPEAHTILSKYYIGDLHADDFKALKAPVETAFVKDNWIPITVPQLFVLLAVLAALFVFLS